MEITWANDPKVSIDHLSEGDVELLEAVQWGWLKATPFTTSDTNESGYRVALFTVRKDVNDDAEMRSRLGMLGFSEGFVELVSRYAWQDFGELEFLPGLDPVPDVPLPELTTGPRCR